MASDQLIRNFCQVDPRRARLSSFCWAYATTPQRHLFEPGRHIDWAFVRTASEPNAGKVFRSINASDHYPISFELRLSAAERRVTSSSFLSFQ